MKYRYLGFSLGGRINKNPYWWQRKTANHPQSIYYDRKKRKIKLGKDCKISAGWKLIILSLAKELNNGSRT